MDFGPDGMSSSEIFSSDIEFIHMSMIRRATIVEGVDPWDLPAGQVPKIGSFSKVEAPLMVDNITLYVVLGGERLYLRCPKLKEDDAKVLKSYHLH